MLASTLIGKMPLEELRPWQIKRIAEAEASEIQAAAQVEKSLCKTRKTHLHSFQGLAYPLRKIVGYVRPLPIEKLSDALWWHAFAKSRNANRQTPITNHESGLPSGQLTAFIDFRGVTDHWSPVADHGRLSLGCHL